MSWSRFKKYLTKHGNAVGFIPPAPTSSSIETHPWLHPFLTASNISRFREYSESVWAYALDYSSRNPQPLNCAFAVNMAQNMYKWASLAAKYGATPTLFLHAMDTFPISMPQ